MLQASLTTPRPPAGGNAGPDPDYVIRVLAEIWGREKGLQATPAPRLEDMKL